MRYTLANSELAINWKNGNGSALYKPAFNKSRPARERRRFVYARDYWTESTAGIRVRSRVGLTLNRCSYTAVNANTLRI